MKKTDKKEAVALPAPPAVAGLRTATAKPKSKLIMPAPLKANVPRVKIETEGASPAPQQ